MRTGAGWIWLVMEFKSAFEADANKFHFLSYWKPWKPERLSWNQKTKNIGKTLFTVSVFGHYRLKSFVKVKRCEAIAVQSKLLYQMPWNTRTTAENCISAPKMSISIEFNFELQNFHSLYLSTGSIEQPIGKRSTQLFDRSIVTRTWPSQKSLKLNQFEE